MTLSTYSPSLATAAFFVLPLLGVGHLLWKLGAFRSITFEKGRLGPSKKVFVYKTSKGPYSGVGPFFQEMETFLAENGFGGGKDSPKTPPPMAGIYYDDPKTTNVPRYAVGFLLDGEDTSSRQIWERIRDTDDVTKKFSVLEIRDTTTIVSSFPIRWMAVSCAISAMKTYPAYEKTGYKLDSGTMEIYHTDIGIIETHFPQANFDQFNPQESDPFPEAGTDQKKVK